ncbi:hypothetical protein M9H77_18324 [Catharanthus roseus]|uniref:Uncharacterized protein n=1 Tax=Catharanthus roseus TaxID=4058 RepID=A0ACC0B764_CATRO|nr:hypothetical protein M9H77_18324 [Catharanthus roseus]
MKAHFFEVHPSFGKVPRIKNMLYTEFEKRYRWDPMHERAIWDAWHRRASLRYKDLMYEVRANRYQPNWITTGQYTSLCDEWGRRNTRRGERRHSRTGCKSVVARGSTSTSRSRSYIKWERRWVRPLHSRNSKYKDLKANAECLHIETCSPILTDKQLMFEAAGGSNKGHVYGLQSVIVTIEHRGDSNNSMLRFFRYPPQ